MADFLLEIGVEEIPDWMIEPALADLRNGFSAAFEAFGGSALSTDATPRRLVLQAQDLLPQAPDVESVAPGPYLSAGEKAAEGFARKQNTTVDKLATAQDAKGERYVFAQLVKGQTALAALSEKLPEIVTNIRFPKTMYWTGKGGVKFIRPIRWIVALLDGQIVPFEMAGVKAGNTTRGHRVLGAKIPLLVGISNYVKILRDNFVIVSAEERRARIEAGLASNVQKDEELLKTLVYLTEFPTPIRGSFDPAYLELPAEILSTVMRHHQRYFSVVQANGSLAPEFVAVTNTDGDPDGLIRQGNERVLRARFNDARFFWEVDQKKKLEERVADLVKVTFQAKLGSYRDKTERVRGLSEDIAKALGADQGVIDRAALLAKADLTTDMVKEFTELQGIVGGLYAKAQGESDDVATAVYDHYQPVSMESPIPRTLEGQILSIADKLDTLRAFFEELMIPTGSKDPFALRRAAQGVVKILFEAKLPLELWRYVKGVDKLLPFMQERIEFYLKEARGYAYDEINAAMAAGFTTLQDLAERTEAIHAVRPTDNFEPLAASFKRIKNILKQSQFAENRPPAPELLAPGPEQELYRAFEKVRASAAATAIYREKLAQIASLRPHVDLFFDKILVNDPDPAIRENRLALLNSLLTEFSTIADFSEIVTQGVSA
jgi:glycyl-tRNA synthetase beta chain